MCKILYRNIEKCYNIIKRFFLVTINPWFFLPLVYFSLLLTNLFNIKLGTKVNF